MRTNRAAARALSSRRIGRDPQGVARRGRRSWGPDSIGIDSVPVPRRYHHGNVRCRPQSPPLMPSEAIVLDGRGRLLPGGTGGPARVAFGETEFTLAVGAQSRVVAYRDMATIAVQGGAALLVLGSGDGAERFLLSQFGQSQGQMVRELRDRRLRQRLGD